MLFYNSEKKLTNFFFSKTKLLNILYFVKHKTNCNIAVHFNKLVLIIMLLVIKVKQFEKNYEWFLLCKYIISLHNMIKNILIKFHLKRGKCIYLCVALFNYISLSREVLRHVITSC